MATMRPTPERVKEMAEAIEEAEENEWAEEDRPYVRPKPPLVANGLTDRQATVVGWAFCIVVGVAWLTGIALWPFPTLIVTGVVWVEEFFRLSHKHRSWPWRTR